MAKHTFENRCIDFEPLLAKTSLAGILKVAKKQAHTKEAHERTDPTYKTADDYTDAEPGFCPAYYGEFTEWFAAHFLNHYGFRFNMHGVEMIDSVGSVEEDLGTDGRGLTIKDQRHASISAITHTPGSTVHIQVKGSLNPTKEHKANDGSRLPNFIMNAVTNSIVAGHAYQDRYVLFTTGAGIHYVLEKMSNNILEVINYKKIKKLMDGDTVFLNVMRKSVGLDPLPYEPLKMDAEAQWNVDHALVDLKD